MRKEERGKVTQQHRAHASFHQQPNSLSMARLARTQTHTPLEYSYRVASVHVFESGFAYLFAAIARRANLLGLYFNFDQPFIVIKVEHQLNKRLFFDRSTNIHSRCRALNCVPFMRPSLVQW